MSDSPSTTRRFKVAKKLEETFGLISFPLLLLLLWGSLKNYLGYRRFIKHSDTYSLSKMKVTSARDGGYKGGLSSIRGYILNNNVDSLNILGIVIKDQHSSEYFDPKYENVNRGDTVSVWYSSQLNRIGLVFPGGINGLIRFETLELKNQSGLAIKMLMFPFSIYFLSRRLRKYYQKKTVQS